MPMNDIDGLRQRAQQSRAEFLQAVSELRQRITVPSIAQSAISAVRGERRGSGREGRLARLAVAVAAVLVAGSRLKAGLRGKDRRQSSRLHK